MIDNVKYYIILIALCGVVADTRSAEQSINDARYVIEVSTNAMRAFYDERIEDQIRMFVTRYPGEISKGPVSVFYNDEKIKIRINVFNEGKVSVRRPTLGWFDGLEVSIENVQTGKIVARMQLSHVSVAAYKGSSEIIQTEILDPGEGLSSAEEYDVQGLSNEMITPGIYRVEIMNQLYHVESVGGYTINPILKSPHLWVIEPRTPKDKAVALCHVGMRTLLGGETESGIGIAEAAFLKAMEIYPEIVCAKSYLAGIYIKSNQLEKALNIIEELYRSKGIHGDLLKEVRGMLEEQKRKK